LTGSTGSEATSGDSPWKMPLLTCGPNDALVVAVETGVAPAAALLARAIPNACAASLPVAPAPEPPATAKNDAREHDRKRRHDDRPASPPQRGDGRKELPRHSFTPWVCSLCDDGVRSGAAQN